MKHLLILLALTCTFSTSAAERKETKAATEREFLSEQESKEQKQLREKITTLPRGVQKLIGSYTPPGPWFWDLFLEKLTDTKDAVISGNGNVIMRSKDNVLYEYKYMEVASGAGATKKAWRWVPIDAKEFKGDLVRINDDGSVFLANLKEQVGMMPSKIRRRGHSNMVPKYEHSTLIYRRTDQEISSPSKISENLELMSDDASVCITSHTKRETNSTTRFCYTRIGNSWQRATIITDYKFNPSDQYLMPTPDGNYLILQSINESFFEVLQRNGDHFKSIFYQEKLPFDWKWQTGVGIRISSNADGTIFIIAKMIFKNSYAILFRREQNKWNLTHNFQTTDEFAQYIPPMISKAGNIIVDWKTTYTNIYRMTEEAPQLIQTLQHEDIHNDRRILPDIPLNMQFMSYDGHIIAYDRLLVFSAKKQQWEVVRMLNGRSQFISNNGFIIKTANEILAIRPEARGLSLVQQKFIELLYNHHKALPTNPILLSKTYDNDQKDLELFTSLPLVVQKVVRDRLNVITVDDPGYQRYQKRKQIERFLTQEELEGYKKLKGRENLDLWLASKQSELDLAQELDWKTPKKIKEEKGAAKKSETPFIVWIEQALTKHKKARAVVSTQPQPAAGLPDVD